MIRCEEHGRDEDHCPDCAAARTLQEDLERLEATDPAVGPAAAKVDDTTRELGRRRASEVRALLRRKAATPAAPPEGDPAA